MANYHNPFAVTVERERLNNNENKEMINII